jgi:hypothetical protein
VLFPNGNIVVAECIAKYDVAMNIIALVAGVPVSPVYRSCRVPQIGSTVSVEFDKRERRVKLFMVEEYANGKDYKSHETYKVDGWLRQSASGPATAQVQAPPPPSPPPPTPAPPPTPTSSPRRSYRPAPPAPVIRASSETPMTRAVTWFDT